MVCHLKVERSQNRFVNWKSRGCHWAPEHIPVPPSVKSARYKPVPGLNISALKPDKKRQVWELIKRDAPELVTLLDEIKDLVAYFDCQVVIPLEQLPASVLKVTGKKR